MTTINKAAVIGAGMMGAEIALSFAAQGIDIILKDINMNLVTAGKDRIHGIVSKWLEKGKITKDEEKKIIGHIIARDNYSGFENVDLVIEAVIEDVEIKRRVISELNEVCKNMGCIFASNTSSIPITQLAGFSSRPDKFIGMHFFSPATVMKLVEIIPGRNTSKETTEKVIRIAREIGKEPVSAPDRAGFIVNRLLFAFFNEAWRMVNDGEATPEDIDKAVKLGLGYPVGIFQMQDLVGLDNALSVSSILFKEYGERFKAAPVLNEKVKANEIGKKVGKGWFDYKN
jgi:3-hydroxybutyryl-CoA dehydrogenase